MLQVSLSNRLFIVVTTVPVLYGTMRIFGCLRALAVSLLTPSGVR